MAVSVRLLKQIREAISNLRPEEVRRTAERSLAIGLVATSSSAYTAIEDFLAPSAVSREKRMELMQMLYRAGDPGLPPRFDLVLDTQPIVGENDTFHFDGANPRRVVREILDRREDLGLPLARHFYPFREPVVDRIIFTVAKENALFALATALPNVMPSLIELPWAVGEFASDTAFLTMNQIRMAFLIAAASDSPIGYREQKAEIASIVAGAFGWRALARELVGKVPLGGGLIPKGAVAFAGTYVVGRSLEKYHAFGYGLTREERRDAYEDALRRGRSVTEKLLASFKRVNAA